MWSWMYLRWWLANQIANVCGRGNYTHAFYLKMLGAKIGNDVNISNAADMGICGDLLTIGDTTH